MLKATALSVPPLGGNLGAPPPDPHLSKPFPLIINKKLKKAASFETFDIKCKIVRSTLHISKFC
jgi:hypothetical protein